MKNNWLIIGTSLLVLSGLVGCSSQESAKESPPAAATATEPKGEGPGFSVEGLKDGDKVKAGDVKLAVSLTNYQLVNFKDHPEAQPGQGHIHMWLDTDPSNPKAALKVIDPNQMILKEIKAGNHTLVIALVGNDHKPAEGSQMQTIHFTAE